MQHVYKHLEASLVTQWDHFLKSSRAPFLMDKKYSISSQIWLSFLARICYLSWVTDTERKKEKNSSFLFPLNHSSRLYFQSISISFSMCTSIWNLKKNLL